MDPIGDGIARVLDEFSAAAAGPYKASPIAIFLRGQLAELIRTVVPDSYIVEGSAGRGRWAETPWLAIFDPLETDSAEHGVYVVFLFRRDGAGVYLTLGQGAWAVITEYGARHRDVLTANAQTYRALIKPKAIEGLHLTPIDLAGTGTLTRGYEAGAIAAQYLGRASLPLTDAEITTVIHRFLDLYAQVLAGKDAVAEPPDHTPGPSTEAAYRRWQERIERSPKLRRDAKRIHGSVCKVCGFDFARRYGPVGAGYIEAHHLVPMASLKGRPTELDPATDFTVVCSNCHSMLHRENPPMTPAKLRGLLRTST